MPTNMVHLSPILLVDDDEVDIMFIEREFKKLNLCVSIDVARDSLQALNKLNDQSTDSGLLPKLIILDLMMPKMNGIEFLQELRAHEKFKDISVLVLTTSNNEQDRIVTQGLKINGYYVKDTQFEDFIVACKALLTGVNYNYPLVLPHLKIILLADCCLIQNHTRFKKN